MADEDEIPKPIYIRRESARSEPLDHTSPEHVQHTCANPSPYMCPTCGRRLEYRLGKKGRFLSCSGYSQNVAEPETEKPAARGKAKAAKGKPARAKKPKHVPACDYALPVDRDDRPLLPEQIDLLSPAGAPMVKRTGRFGDFLVEDKPRPPKPKGKKAAEALPAEPPLLIINLDRNGNIKFPAPPPLVTDIACEKCGAMMNLRDGKQGPWLGCQRFPKCRGHAAFAELPEAEQQDLSQRLKKYVSNHEPIYLTRRDGVTRVLDGTPLSAITLPGSFADLPPWTS